MQLPVQDILFHFCGGLALFLFGIKYMSEGLQSAAGKRLRYFLEKGTKTPLRGVLTGATVTALIQSSSGTSVLTVGLVNAGLLNLRQAIGIIMGANIGTTLTAYLIGFEIKEYALPIMAVGAVLLFFLKQEKAKLIGQVLFGFGTLFYGMEVMGSGLKPLRDWEYFLHLMTNVQENPLIGVAIGTVFTVVVQSSSATIGVLQELASQGLVTYQQAVPILFGDNIGTTITALLAAIGASVAARRAAVTHLLFNLSGTAVFLPLTIVGIFPEIVRLLTDYLYVFLPGFEGAWATMNIRMQIAQTHGVFNLTNTLVQLPLVGFLAWAVTRLVPSREGELRESKYLEPRVLGNPDVALGQAMHEIQRMGRLARGLFHGAMDYFFGIKPDDKGAGLKAIEAQINLLDTEITDYLVKLSYNRMNEAQSIQASILQQAVTDLERIGDHAENVLELAWYAEEHGVEFSDHAGSDLESMVDLTDLTLQQAMNAMEKNNVGLARQVLQNEIVIDKMEKDFRKAHLRRLNENVCTAEAGAVYLDLLSNLERIGDHSVNIAEYVLGESGAEQRHVVRYELENDAN
ncbi:MAG: Na/Pi cotransporter family protein [Firmicutes bacterium]|nr:Na/Pi cotransporter family protein [Bacillota bacterium]